MTGIVILLTAKKVKLNRPNTWISKLIELIQGKYTHSAIIYKQCDGYYVRDVDGKGVHRTKLCDYILKYKDRIKDNFYRVKNIQYKYPIKLNDYCIKDNSKYDFKNLILFQLLLSITGKYFGKKTKYEHTCSEDTARCINQYVGFELFENPDSIYPTYFNECGLLEKFEFTY